MRAKVMLLLSALGVIAGLVALPVQAGADPLTPSAITLFGPTSPPQPEPAPIFEPFKLHGTLTINHAAAPAGTKVTVTRTAPGGAVKTLTASTTATGVYVATDTLTALGTYSYTASYAGTSAIAPAASAAVTVAATGDRPVLTLNGNSDPQTVAYKAKLTLTAHLGTTHSKRTVGIYQQLPNGTERLLKLGAVNAAGNLAMTVTMTQNQTFSAVFPGDAEDVSVTAYDVVHVRPIVTASISGYASTIKVAGITYRVYHHTARLKAALTVTPNKHGECFKLEAQSNAGSWDPNVTSACATLTTTSKGTGYLTLTKATYRHPYRVRVDFVPGKSDKINVASSSGWLYFMVEK